MPSKEEIIKKFWPKPQECNILNIPVMREAIGKMMDEAMGVVHKVTGCKDCPMCNSESDGWDSTFRCNYNLSLPEENNFEIQDEEVTPDWCPLSKSSITISKNKI